MRLRIWCETSPWSELAAGATVERLAHHRIDPIIAVRPGDLHGLAELDAAYRAAGLRPAYWPMLSDEDGRWAGSGNMDRFVDFARALLFRLPPGDDHELIIDLEPPIEPTRQLTHVAGPRSLLGATSSIVELARKISPRRLGTARAALVQLVDELARRRVRVSACVLPPLVLDRGRAWETLLGTPLSGPRWHEVHVMLYSSILEGWSKGTLDREDARALVSRFSAATQRRLGPRAAVALGVVGTGAFGDEPVYRHPGELADDVQLARAAGVTHVSLFDLGGLSRRTPHGRQAWIDAFAGSADDAPAPRPTASLRADVLYGVAALVGLAGAPPSRVWTSRV